MAIDMLFSGNNKPRFTELSKARPYGLLTFGT
jgi:hypothetical protein